MFASFFHTLLTFILLLIFDEFVVPHCSRKSDDKPPPIPQDNEDEVDQEPLQDRKSVV